MDIKTQLDGLDGLFDQCREVVKAEMAVVGEEYVSEAQQEGNYHNVTGRLRAGNYFQVEDDGLELGNREDYASNVEARGYEVSSVFALRAEAKLKERFEK